jgi:hypothetical protein
MRINRFEEYSLQDSILNDFLNSFDSMITESDDIDYKKVQKKIIEDLKLSTSLVLTFSVGVTTFFPIVKKLMENSSISSVDFTPDKIVLLTIAAITIIYLEEKKGKISAKQEEVLTKDSKSMLEELKLMGIGNGIVKKLIESLKSIRNIFSLIGKHIGAVIGGFMDIFSYTAIMIPLMNAIEYVIGKYDLNVDTIISNFAGLAIGIGTLVAKHGISEIINKIKGKFPVNKKEIIDEIETPVIQKFGDIRHDDDDVQGGELIKEQ